jgi:hypothetical protein
VDRQHAAARLQALQVRLGRPSALQQDSRLQVRAEIDASELGRFPRRIHNLPVLINNSRYFGQNNRDSKISIILIRITGAHRRDCIGSIAWDFAIPLPGQGVTPSGESISTLGGVAL